jgi:tetratricopeptide (TPR) repeat protein
MSGSHTEEEEAIIPNLAYGYTNRYIRYEPAKYRHPSQVFGAENIVMSVEDFYKYDKALHEGKLLSEKYQKLINTPYQNGYGHGWNLSYYPKNNGTNSVLLAPHDGGTAGFVTLACRFIGDIQLIVILSNVFLYDNYSIARGISWILNNHEGITVKRYLAEHFTLTVDRFGVDSAVNEFNRVLNSQEELYQIDVGELNVLGYQYMNESQFNEAIAILTLYTEISPEDGNAYDSLAEAYLKSGNNERAIENYTRSLSLDPNNSYAKGMLEKLNSGP